MLILKEKSTFPARKGLSHDVELNFAVQISLASGITPCIIPFIERRRRQRARVRKRSHRPSPPHRPHETPSISQCLLHPPPLVDSNPGLNRLGFFFRLYPASASSASARRIHCQRRYGDLDEIPWLCLCPSRVRQYNLRLFRHARGKRSRESLRRQAGRPGPQDRPTRFAGASTSLRESVIGQFSNSQEKS